MRFTCFITQSQEEGVSNRNKLLIELYHHYFNFRSCEQDIKVVQEKLQKAQEKRTVVSVNRDILKFVIFIIRTYTHVYSVWITLFMVCTAKMHCHTHLST